MLYELRTYQAMPGRMPDLLKRFETVTVPIWERHGIRPAGFWTTLIGKSNHRLYYFLKWESLAERDQKWAAFQSDPEWLEKRTQSERNGPLVTSAMNEILQPTPFSTVQ